MWNIKKHKLGKSSKLFLIIIFGISFSILTLPTQTYAQEDNASSEIGFTLAPSISIIEAAKGDTFSREITISKELEGAIPVGVSISPYSPFLGDNRSIDAKLKDASDWVEISKGASFILTDEGEQTVNIDVRIPQDTGPGTYFTTVLFQPQLPPTFFDSQSIQILPHIATLLVIDVDRDKRVSESAKIREFTYRITEQKSYDYFEVELENKSDFYKSLEGIVTVKDIKGASVKEIMIEENRLLPREKKVLTIPNEDKLPFGAYRAELAFVGDTEDIQKDTFFISLDMKRDILKIGLLFSVLTASIYVIGRRVIRSGRASD